MSAPLGGQAEVVGISRKDEACRSGRELRTEPLVAELVTSISGFRVSARYLSLLAAVLK